ncbi:hypothetical protein GUITHDRAFT_120215 [Guillardia theta CCMP2712]|uniref:Multidrug and toxic compound extrusion protein n=1 Tax=Guillardia theta (strain CCMP2712) TaxID=905079 RepID=L1IBD6_GUITC|nr:hypothetical protein GUITHDRAFT_120215 [Guillardia theta CCMP2712]EKX33576.1 hypothetical protein GUITHDRAFT_120215 [Guillardia theta CCMP2712]|mmetsp:Transcript_44019/g.138910  ORF Transcript_44019/g.138910 Transcript_44019/m.138910 type:complete len:581 (-) Transcript_44019:1291-3033(-)|eukprot:XP_005820556.1 hypothetical protein GUITHDRAFT_120215 [Guillardia theta CCMP2712]
MSIIAVTATAVAAILTGCSETHAFQPSMMGRAQPRMASCNHHQQKFLPCSLQRHPILIQSTSQPARSLLGKSKSRVRCQDRPALRGAEQASESEEKKAEATNSSIVSGKARLYGATETRRGHGGGFVNGLLGAVADREFDAAIFALAIPALGSLIIEPVVRTLEAVMVGRLGAAPLGALSIGGSVVSVSFPLFNFFSYATTPMVARALARDDPNEASRLVAQGIWLSTAVGCVLGTLMFKFADNILKTMGSNAEIFPFARAFLIIRAFAAPAELWLLVAKGASYGHQNTRAPLLAIATGSAVHLVLDAVFILGLEMGLSGAALAVVISQYLAALFLLRCLVQDGILKISDLRRLPDITKIFTYLSAGSALLIRTMSMQAFYTVMTSYGARMGTAVIAAHAIARQCSSLEALVVDGLAVAAQALVAMYIGKGDRVSARRLCRRLLFLGGVAGTVLGGLLWAASGPIASVFSTDPNVLAEARRAMPLVAAIQLPAALAYIFDGIFLGARDFRFLGIAMFFCVIPASAVLVTVAATLDVGLLTLWMASGTLLVSRVIALSWRYNSDKGPLSPSKDVAAAQPSS